jgi:hypothetical protein
VSHLARFVPVLSAPPAALTKRAAQRRVLLLLDALKKPPAPHGVEQWCGGPGGGGGVGTWVMSAAALAAVWRRYPAYLLTEFKAWLPPTHHDAANAAWAPIVAAFLATHRA